MTDTLTTAIDELDAELATNDAAAAAWDERRPRVVDAIVALRNLTTPASPGFTDEQVAGAFGVTLADVGLADPPTSPPPPASTTLRAQLDAPSPATGVPLECEVPGCGKRFNSAHGLLVHTSRLHKTTASVEPGGGLPDPAPAGEPSPVAAADANEELVLACNSCSLVLPANALADMRRHTKALHLRSPEDSERTPIRRGDA